VPTCLKTNYSKHKRSLTNT